jgi:hypothetical protein
MEKVTVEGEVVKFLFINPHAFVLLTVKDASTARWTVEWEGANTLRRHGITADTQKPGDQVMVVGHPAREEGRLYLVSITRPADNWEWRRQVLR